MTIFVIIDEKEIDINQIKNLSLPNSVKKLTQELIPYLNILDNIKLQFLPEQQNVFTKIFKHEDLYFIFLKKLYFRRGTIIFGLQKSINGVKVVSYYSDTMHHKSTCFGTTPNIDLVLNYKKELLQDKTFINDKLKILLVK